MFPFPKRKEMPVFTGVTRGVGGYGFGGGSGAAAETPPAALPGAPNMNGGNVSTPGNGYRYCTFKNSGNLVVPQTCQVDIIVVGGGGGGGGVADGVGGGGGGGGVAHGEAVPLDPGTYAVTLGGGGGQRTPTSNGEGTNTTFASGTDWEIRGLGGGGGGCGPRNSTQTGNPGGNGGGRHQQPGSGAGNATQPTDTPNCGTNVQDYITQYGRPGVPDYPGAGGLGSPMTADGQPFSDFSYPLCDLSPLDPLSPTTDQYGGGGGNTQRNSGRGGYGGGGAGSPNGSSGQGDLGGGGGGGHNGNNNEWKNGGSGGEGVVIVRTPI